MSAQVQSPDAGWQGRLAQFWAARNRRERVLLIVGSVVLLAALLVSLGVLPAWRTLKTAPQEQARLDTEWQRMQALKAQSASLLKQPRREFNETALRASLAPLGETARLELKGRGADLTLQNANPEAVATWLVKSRAEAGAVVREAHLQRGQREGQAVWNGKLMLALAP